jgi:hypothetical protein
MAHRIFISYSRTDIDFVCQLAEDLEQAGFDVWWDISNLRGGDAWVQSIQTALKASKYCVIVLSPASIKSEWVEKEYMYAIALRLRVIPVLYRTCEIPMALANIHRIDFQENEYQRGLQEILAALPESQRHFLQSGITGSSATRTSLEKKVPPLLRDPTRRTISAILVIAVIVALGYAIYTVHATRSNLDIPMPPLRSSETTTTAGVIIAATDTPTYTYTPTRTPTHLFTPTLTYTPAPPTSTDTPLPPTLTDTPVPSTPTDTPVPPTPTPTHTLTPEPTVPIPAPGITAPILQFPADGDSVAAENPTNFKWQWNGILQEGWGFEVLIWQEKEDPHYGAYDARELTEKLLKHQADGTYTASFKVEAAQSVTQHRAGNYYWSVVVVQLDPKYERIGSEAPPHKLHISIGGGEEGGPGSKPPPP